MKSSLVFISTLATLASYAIADPCATGLNYCGYNLVRKGMRSFATVEFLQRPRFTVQAVVKLIRLPSRSLP
jgi:hypothetical protein